MALMRKSTGFGDLGKIFLAGEQLPFGFFDLTVQEKVLRRNSQELGKPSVEVEWTEMNGPGNLAERWSTMEFVFHEPQCRDKP